jgi:hypothetical protein
LSVTALGWHLVHIPPGQGGCSVHPGLILQLKFEKELNHWKWNYVEMILLLSSKDLFKLKFCKKDQSLTVLNVVFNTLMIFNCVFISGVNLHHWRIWAVELNLDVQNIHLGLQPGLKPTIYHTWGRHANHYTTDVISGLLNKLKLY